METLLQQLASTSPIEWLGMATGTLGVWLSIKEKVSAWLFFILCYGIYVYIGYASGLFAFTGMNAVFIGISAYGWMQWSKQEEPTETLSITKTASTSWPWIGLFLVAATLAIGYLSDLLDGATLPYFDAFATCSAFIAQWMLSRKRIETWLFWILSNGVFVGIFVSSALWPSALLFTVFIFLAIKGWLEWQSQIKRQPPPAHA